MCCVVVCSDPTSGLNYGVLNGRAGTLCYTLSGDSPQPMMAATAGVFLCFYLITSQILSAKSGVLMSLQEKEELDVRYPQVYVMVVSSVKVFLTASLLLANSNPWAVLALCLAGGAFLMLWTALFPVFFGIDVSRDLSCSRFSFFFFLFSDV
jgi:hypothetical protein